MDLTRRLGRLNLEVRREGGGRIWSLNNCEIEGLVDWGYEIGELEEFVGLEVGGWRLEDGLRLALWISPVRRALGRSRFVGVGQSRWRSVVLWLKTNDVVSLVLGRRS